MKYDKVGVHATHCCKLHGCKYGDEDCPVYNGPIDAEYDCEMCIENEKKFLEENNMTTGNGCRCGDSDKNLGFKPGTYEVAERWDGDGSKTVLASPVETRLQDLARVIENLRDGVCMLRDKLTDVMVPDKEGPSCTDDGKDRKPSSKLVETLEVHIKNVVEIENIVHNMRERTELS